MAAALGEVVGNRWPNTLEPEDARDRAVELAERDLDGDASADEVRLFLSRYSPLEQAAARSAYDRISWAVHDGRLHEDGQLDIFDACDTTDPAVASDRIGARLDAALIALFPPARALEPGLAVSA